jgi:hypothetical protein
LRERSSELVVRWCAALAASRPVLAAEILLVQREAFSLLSENHDRKCTTRRLVRPSAGGGGGAAAVTGEGLGSSASIGGSDWGGPR